MQIESIYCNSPDMSHVTLKQVVRALLLSYQKKDWLEPALKPLFCMFSHVVYCMDLDFGTFTYPPLEVIFFMTVHLLIECIKPC